MPKGPQGQKKQADELARTERELNDALGRIHKEINKIADEEARSALVAKELDRNLGTGPMTTGSIKNPNQEAERPAPMPKKRQGQGGSSQDRDPEGQQGGRRRRGICRSR